MKYVSVFYVIVSLFAVCVFSTPTFSSDEITPDEVLRIADQEKERFFGLIGIEYIKKYGDSMSVQVSSKVDYPDLNTLAVKEGKRKASLKLDQPFLIHTINSDDVMNYRDGDDLSSILKPTNEWIVPLNINGKANAYISVGFMDGKWQAVGISMGDFAENLKKSVPPESMPGKGGRYVKIYPAYIDFVAVEDSGETKMMPLHSDHVFSSIEKLKDSKGHYRASDIMPKIADSVRAAIAMEN